MASSAGLVPNYKPKFQKWLSVNPYFLRGSHRNRVFAFSWREWNGDLWRDEDVNSLSRMSLFLAALREQQFMSSAHRLRVSRRHQFRLRKIQYSYNQAIIEKEILYSRLVANTQQMRFVSWILGTSPEHISRPLQPIAEKLNALLFSTSREIKVVRALGQISTCMVLPSFARREMDLYSKQHAGFVLHNELAVQNKLLRTESKRTVTSLASYSTLTKSTPGWGEGDISTSFKEHLESQGYSRQSRLTNHLREGNLDDYYASALSHVLRAFLSNMRGFIQVLKQQTKFSLTTIPKRHHAGRNEVWRRFQNIIDALDLDMLRCYTEGRELALLRSFRLDCFPEGISTKDITTAEQVYLSYINRCHNYDKNDRRRINRGLPTYTFTYRYFPGKLRKTWHSKKPVNNKIVGDGKVADDEMRGNEPADKASAGQMESVVSTTSTPHNTVLCWDEWDGTIRMIDGSRQASRAGAYDPRGAFLLAKLRLKAAQDRRRYPGHDLPVNEYFVKLRTTELGTYPLLLKIYRIQLDALTIANLLKTAPMHLGNSLDILTTLVKVSNEISPALRASIRIRRILALQDHNPLQFKIAAHRYIVARSIRNLKHGADKTNTDPGNKTSGETNKSSAMRRIEYLKRRTSKAQTRYLKKDPCVWKTEVFDMSVREVVLQSRSVINPLMQSLVMPDMNRECHPAHHPRIRWIFSLHDVLFRMQEMNTELTELGSKLYDLRYYAIMRLNSKDCE